MPDFVLSISVSLYDRRGPAGRLELREETELGELTFPQLAVILSRYHDLAQNIKMGAP
jgi:hypothetical protein